MQTNGKGIEAQVEIQAPAVGSTRISSTLADPETVLAGTVVHGRTKLFGHQAGIRRSAQLWVQRPSDAANQVAETMRSPLEGTTENLWGNRLVQSDRFTPPTSRMATRSQAFTAVAGPGKPDPELHLPGCHEGSRLRIRCGRAATPNCSALGARGYFVATKSRPAAGCPAQRVVITLALV